MGVARDRFVALCGSAEYSLSRTIPFLVALRTASAREDGTAAVGVRQARSVANDITGDIGTPGFYVGPSAKAATDARTAVETFMAAWDPDREGNVSRLVAGWDHGALGILEDPVALEWVADSPAQVAFKTEMKQARDEMGAETRLEARDRAFASLHVGCEVALERLGQGVVKLGVILSGSRGTGFTLDDDSHVAFLDNSSSSGWYIPAVGTETGYEVRPMRPLDKQMMAARQGLMLEDGTTVPPGAKASPTEGFVAAAVRRPPGVRLVHCDEEIPLGPILDSVLPGVGFGTLLAYMNRRFGPPTLGGDDEKDLCGIWFLKTPDPEAFVCVQPSVNGGDFSFRVLVSHEAARRLGAAARGYYDELYGRVEGAVGEQAFIREVAPYGRAVRAVLSDLLRPVAVRDCWLNVLGTDGDEGEVSMEYPVDGKGKPFADADYSPASVIAMPHGFWDDLDALWDLSRALHQLQPGDPAAALRKANGILKAHLDAEATPDGTPPAP